MSVGSVTSETAEFTEKIFCEDCETKKGTEIEVSKRPNNGEVKYNYCGSVTAAPSETCPSLPIVW
jgi:hypothetical protein